MAPKRAMQAGGRVEVRSSLSFCLRTWRPCLGPPQYIVENGDIQPWWASVFAQHVLSGCGSCTIQARVATCTLAGTINGHGNVLPPSRHVGAVLGDLDVSTCAAWSTGHSTIHSLVTWSEESWTFGCLGPCKTP